MSLSFADQVRKAALSGRQQSFGGELPAVGSDNFSKAVDLSVAEDVYYAAFATAKRARLDAFDRSKAGLEVLASSLIEIAQQMAAHPEYTPGVIAGVLGDLVAVPDPELEPEPDQLPNVSESEEFAEGNGL